MSNQRALYPYSFGGEAHQRPIQSYGGFNNKKNREDLLRHLEEERRRREHARQCEAASTKIQAVWRGTIARNFRQRSLAQTFHSVVGRLQTSASICDLKSADTLLRCMVFSRLNNLPEDDIHWFAGQVLRDTAKFLPVLVVRDSAGNPILYRLKAFLLHVLTRICVSPRPTTALRLLELLLNPTIYTSYCDNKSGLTVDTVKQAVEFLINHDFYKTLFQTFASKTDASLELLPGQGFPQGFPGAILQLMLLPLVAVKTDEIVELVTTHFVFDVICRPETIVARFVLPSFLLSDVADHFAIILSKCILQNRNKSSNLEPVTYIHLLWFVLNGLKTCEHLKLSFPDAKSVIECLAFLLKHMPSNAERQQEGQAAMQTDEGSDDEDPDEEVVRHVSQMDSLDSSVWSNLPDYAKQMHLEITDVICGERFFSNFLHSIIENTSKDISSSADDGTVQIAQIFYELIYRHGVTPAKMRESSLPVFDKELLRRLYFRTVSLFGPIQYPVQVTLLQRIESGLPLHQLEYGLLVPIFVIFSKFFHWLLLCINDAEFLEQTPGFFIPFSTAELVDITANFRKVCAGLVDVLSPSRFFGPSMKVDSLVTSPRAYMSMFRAACHLLKHLYSRNVRLNFLPEGFWSSVLTTVRPVYPPPFGLISYLLQPFQDPDMLLTGEFVEQGLDPSIARGLTANEIHLAIVLTSVPFLLPFEYRYDVFRAVLNRDRDANLRSRPMGLDDGLTIDIRVRRQYLYEDAFDRLSLENAPNLKKRVRCHLVNFTGLDEAGIDGGGLFREFFTELIRTAFDPNRGLFCYTPSTKDCRLYPNPAAETLYPDNWKMHFFFLGRVVGKLLYEKLLVEMPLADFFLAKILSRDALSLDVHHLADLDPVLYKNLLFLKTYSGNVEDLGLDFTVLDDSGLSPESTKVIELIPGGKQTPVTAENRIFYIHMISDYKLNRRISAHCRAFVDGLSHVVNLDWLRMFSPSELQTLISGAEKPINVTDLMVNTRYTGAYNEDHQTIKVFWSAVKNRLTEDQRRKLLKFVTSCSRPPMFGFKDLEPPFTVHSSGPPDQNGTPGSGGGGQRLPSASTCINLLKLPEYTDEDTMYERLCYAIESEAGFELS